MIHSSSLCETSKIGCGTKIWAFTHILSGAIIGSNCNICDGVFIEGNVVIGDRVTVKCGVQLWNGVRVENDVFIGPNATFTNDDFPRSLDHSKPILETRICEGASIGANATILPGVVIGRRAMIGAGAVVTKSVPPFAIVVGNPGRIIGYSNSGGRPAKQSSVAAPNVAGVTPLSVRGVTVHRFKAVHDLRGDLTVGNFEHEIPFTPKRHFLVYNVPSTEVRGEHAHYSCHQFLIAANGSVSVMADDGNQRQEVLLDSRDQGIYLPPLTWGVQYKYTSDAVLLVFASHAYDSDDYIRDYDAFVGIISKQLPRAL
jgi:UDP-2-acetamido-3-amino-2,3-dideoxy-glucuronate N-acetyltransferase